MLAIPRDLQVHLGLVPEIPVRHVTAAEIFLSV